MGIGEAQPPLDVEAPLAAWFARQRGRWWKSWRRVVIACRVVLALTACMWFASLPHMYFYLKSLPVPPILDFLLKGPHGPVLGWLSIAVPFIAVLLVTSLHAELKVPGELEVALDPRVIFAAQLKALRGSAWGGLLLLWMLLPLLSLVMGEARLLLADMLNQNPAFNQRGFLEYLLALRTLAGLVLTVELAVWGALRLRRSTWLAAAALAAIPYLLLAGGAQLRWASPIPVTYAGFKRYEQLELLLSLAAAGVFLLAAAVLALLNNRLPRRESGSELS